MSLIFGRDRVLDGEVLFGALEVDRLHVDVVLGVRHYERLEERKQESYVLLF
jgi:hypothetical protein